MPGRESCPTLGLRRDVDQLAGVIGERNIYRFEQLERAAEYIQARWREAGLRARRHEYPARGRVFANLEVEVRGWRSADEIVVVGAHYDTARGTAGADDNATGVAALLKLSRDFAQGRPARTLRFVAFTNEERPFLRTRLMGSRVYAAMCRARSDHIVAMISLEMLGFCSSEKGSQRLSIFGKLTPRTADFVALVANRKSASLIRRAAAAFREHSSVACQTFTLPEHFPGAWSSDQWSFWKEGFPGIMVSDTARLRNRHYHTSHDLPDTLDYDWMGRVVDGIAGIVAELAHR